VHRSVLRRSQRSPEAGLTIVEVLVASAILAVVVSAVLTTTYSGLRLQATSRERATATYWAEHLMEQARNQAYESIGLTDTSAEVAAAMAGVPAGDLDNPDLRLRRSAAGNCLEFNTGTSASPAWERLVLADWHSSPASASSCSLEAVDDDFHLEHAGVDNDYVAAGTPAVTYRGWVFVTWAAVHGTSAWYKRVTVVVRFPAPTGGISRLVQTSSTFSLGYVPATPAAATTTTPIPTTTIVLPTTTTPTTLPACPPKAGDSRAPTGSIDLAGGAGYTNQLTVDVTNSVTDPAGGSGMATMAFSNGSAGGPFLPVPPAVYAALYSGWPIPAGDGPKTVWGRFADCNGNATVLADTVTLDQTLPPSPTLSGSVGRKKVTLSWTAVTDPGSSASGLLGYRVYRADKGAATPLATVAAGTTSYTDNSLTSGRPYTYWVTAVDRAGNQSQPESNHYTGTPT
jgi:hypothetical protein